MPPIRDRASADGAERPKAPASSAPLLHRWAAPAALILITIALYAPSLRNGFVWDDDSIIVSNPRTRSLAALPTVLLSPDETPPYYRPLNRASYLVDYQVFGMDPRGFHAVNVLAHAATVIALYLLGLRLFSRREPAFVAALLLAIHPLNVEAVEFISGRNTILATLFGVLAVVLGIDAFRSASWRRALASALAFFLGLLSKEPAFIVLPFLAAWYAWPRERAGRRISRDLARLLPHLFALGVYAALRTASLGGLVGSAPPSRMAATAPLLSRLAANLYTIPKYLSLALFPRALSVYHVIPSDWPAAVVIGAWLGIAAVVVYVAMRPSIAAVAGLLWFALNLAPIANVVPIPTTSLISERYLYAPAIGLWLLGADLVERVARRVGWRLPATALAIAAAALAIRTSLRIPDWRDDLSLATTAVQVEPRAPEAHFNLTKFLAAHGDLDGSLHEAHVAVSLAPDLAEAHFNLGVVLKDRGDLDGALAEWRAALALDPQHAKTIVQLAIADAVRGDLRRAEAGLRQAIDLDPSIALAHYNLARICDLSGRSVEARSEYEAFLRLGRETAEEQAFLERARARLAALR